VPDTLTNSVGITLKRIPAESPPNDAADPRSPPSRPARVTRPFHIGIYEVTNGQWNAVMGDARGDPREAAHPVEAFGLPEAMRFCRTLSELPEERKAGRVYRLPSEHEWEHACRAGTTTAWSCGDDEAVLVDHAWIRRNSDNRPHAVGGRKPNAWGLYDMHGNVMELCGSSRSLAAADAASAQEEPAKGEMLMMRGGNWLTEAVICRSGTRLAAPAVNPRTGEPVRMAGVGLRVAMDLTEPDDPDAPVRSSAGVAPAVRDRDAR
jgi:formylglycine-generating enzyme required for sulfatase activity